MNKKRKLLLTITFGIVGVLVVFGVIVGLTYAYFIASINGNQNASSIEVDTARLATVQFTDSALINANNMLPGTSITKTFSVGINGQNTIPMSYQVFMYWKNSGITDMVYILSGGGTPATIKAINTVQNDYKKDQIATGTFSANTSATHNYALTLTFRETSENQNSQQGKTFSAYLQVEFAVGGTTICYNNENSNGYDCTSAQPLGITLANAIKRDNPEYLTQTVQNDTMFESNATTDTGLWTENRTGKTEGNLPVYFFRGAVVDNYVKFGTDESGDLIWRVIRINEDGSVRMILDKKLLDNAAFQEQSVEFSKRNMYMPNNEVVSGSAADVLNTWYNTTFTIVEKSKVSINAIYCNDMSVGWTDGEWTDFGAYTRLEANSPQFLCPQTNDKLVSTSSTLNASTVNKVLLQPIGLITVDEVMYAGEAWEWDANNDSFYLYKSYNYWTLSPCNSSIDFGSVFNFFVDIGNGLDSSIFEVYLPLDLVPVITLRPDILTTGTGVVGDEYIIQ